MADPTPDPQSTLPDRERGSSDVVLVKDGGGGDASPLPAAGKRYEPGALLGAGATSRVYAAHDRIFDREVAMKMLASPDGASAARFIREARITARVEHPNVVPVHDLEFSAGGSVYFTMRKVVGVSLGEAIRQAAAGTAPPVLASPNRLVTALLKACDAVAHAHARGVVHRDLKPDNLLLGEYGELVVVDWGEAVVRGDEGDSARPRTVGTPAYMSPEQARGEPADERSDVYCLGATLLTALLRRPPLSDPDQDRFWRRKRAGDWDRPTTAETALAPAALLAIAGRAMAADPAERYQRVADFAADLERWQAGQAVQAYREPLAARLRRWHRLHARVFWPSLAAGILAVAGSLYLWDQHRKETAGWGRPIVSEDFSDDSWRTRWHELRPGAWERRDGRLVSIAPTDAYLVLDRRLSGAVAVEFTGEITPGTRPCDLSLWWSEAAGGFDPVRIFSGAAGYRFQVGAFDNQFCAIWRQNTGERVAVDHRKMEIGRTYRIRFELDGKRVAILIDGETVCEHVDPIPIGSGQLLIYAYYAGKAFDDIRVWTREVPQRVPVLAIGDAFFQEGDLARAAAHYRLAADSHPGTSLAADARFREGLALWLAKDRVAAHQAWDRLPVGDLRSLAEIHALDECAESGDMDALEMRFRSLWAHSPACHHDLIRGWVHWMKSAERLPARRNEVLDRLIALRQAHFPDDALSGEAMVIALFLLGRHEQIAAHFPRESHQHANALNRLGRHDEVVAQHADLPGQTAVARFSNGDLAAIVDDRRSPDWAVARALCSLGRGDEALRRYAHSSEVMIRLGRFEDALTRGWISPDERSRALLMLGRTDEALAVRDWVDNRERPLAMVVPLLWQGRIGEAVKVDSHSQYLATWRAVAAQAEGGSSWQDWKREWEGALAPGSGDPPQLRLDLPLSWCGPYLLLPFWLAMDGDAQAFARAADRVEALHARRFGRRAPPVVRFLAGRADLAAVRAMPFADEAEPWCLLAGGMRAELQGDPVRAISSYLGYLLLPTHRRLLDGNPDPGLERFMAGRIATLMMRMPGLSPSADPPPGP